MLRLLRGPQGLSGLSRSSRTLSRSSESFTYGHLSLSVGDRVGDTAYRISNIFGIPSQQLQVYDLIHERTNSRHVHVARDDDNSVFCIGFRTNPPDHSGLPHILEHTTLCGSQKYPVRDPFFLMLTRSLSNFMNAMTGFDYTFYPFATTNVKDFKNLQDVYLDAVFRPLLREQDFRQEGWRLENADPRDRATPLEFKGVVYNEMKGQLVVLSNKSNVSYLFYIKYFESIYPSLNNSGGNPKFITALKYNDLKKFHADHYHPSNAFTFSYGRLHPKEILTPLDNAIKQFAKREIASDVKHPIELTESKLVTVEGPIDPLYDEIKQYKVSLSWIVGDSSDLKSTYMWKVLSHLLTDGHSSPFHKALIDTQIGTDFSVNTGVDITPAKNIFTIGLQGMDETNIEVFKKTVADVLKDIVQNGIPKERVDAIINQEELADKEVESNFGLSLVYRLYPRVFNDKNVLDSLDNEKVLSSFKDIVAKDPLVFQKMIAEYLIDNPVFEFKMVPSEYFEDYLVQEESERLDKAVGSLTEQEKDVIYRKGLELVENQEKKQDPSVLPSLSTDDIDRQGKTVSNQEEFVRTPGSPVVLMSRQTVTRGLSYMSLMSDVTNKVPQSLLPFLSLYIEGMKNVGTKNYPMEELENAIKLNTGGINSSFLLTSDPTNKDDVKLNLVLSGSSLDAKAPKVFDLLKEMFLLPTLSNVGKLKPLITASVSNSLNALAETGHSYAMNHSAASISLKRRLSEHLDGLSQIQLLRQLAEFTDDQLSTLVVPKLDEIKNLVATQGQWKSLIIQPQEDTLELKKTLVQEFISGLPVVESTSCLPNGPLEISHTHVQLPFQVAYIGVSIPGVSYDNKHGAALQILSNILTHKYLHGEIREKGGAYGGGARYSGVDGVFSFYSYRDPNPSNSLEVVQNAPGWVLNTLLTERYLQEAKLSIFQGIDAPISPRNELNDKFFYMISDQLKQQRRQNLLNVTLDDLYEVTKLYLEPNLAGFKGAGATVLGPAKPAGWKSLDFDQEPNVYKF